MRCLESGLNSCKRRSSGFSRFLKIALLILILSINEALPAFSHETIRIGGSGGALGTIKLLAADFERKRPGTTITVFPSMGSSGGIKAALDGAIDIALSARPANGEERGVVAREYARTPLVFAVGKNNNSVSDFTISQLADIYAGKTTTWPDARRLRLVLRPASEYDNVLLKSMSGDMERALRDALSREGMIVEVTDQDSARAIEKVPGALGTITLGQIISEKRSMKALSVNGVKPRTKTLADGTYPYFKTYYFISKKDTRPVVREFIAYVYSAAGRLILSRSGYLVKDR